MGASIVSGIYTSNYCIFKLVLHLIKQSINMDTFTSTEYNLERLLIIYYKGL